MAKTTKQDIIQAIAQHLKLSMLDATKIYDKAKAGGEFSTPATAEHWFNNRLLPNVVWIDELGYAQMCVDALKILGTTAATDYGSSRQRDLGQLWGDMTRGYLAEYATSLYLKYQWEIDAQLAHEKGDLDAYLPTDISAIRHTPSEPWRRPALNIGIKGTKWNGIWLDIPGQQFFHSDIHILVKVGVSRDHLFAYFKHISVFKDKVLRKGIEVGSLDETEANSLFDALPDFEPIPAYIAGFISKNQEFDELPYEGKKGRKHFTVTSWRGALKTGDLERIVTRENLPGGGQVKFEGIGKFSSLDKWLFNTGSLSWRREDWQEHVINKL